MITEETIFKNCNGFDWDAANLHKNEEKHNVLSIECEQLFFNHPLLIGEDEKHSYKEKRYYALGKTNNNRKLFIVFTIRKKLLRVISVRDMSKKERAFYETA